ncbi:dihydrofolate reductase [Bosea sp. RAC05]|uniref:dihydrofolate reductase n=1 Tax=Bosea sp. RAC05 TaxID=1842539 RepID=UPI00083E2964|nr:dihydrofolate reductase [Bosea sp. RAC05]AOG02835.1 dihydrofolate reductase family protein [Bosea sp. RAC05]
MKLILVAAIDDERGIGRDGDLAWHHSADMRSFRETTLRGWLIMGRATWQSIGRPLPGRQIIVLSRSEMDLPASVFSSASLEKAIDIVRTAGADEAYICGGSVLYDAAIGIGDVLVLTRIPGTHGCDRFFPDWADHGYVFHSEEEIGDGLRRQLWRRDHAVRSTAAGTSK